MHFSLDFVANVGHSLFALFDEGGEGGLGKVMQAIVLRIRAVLGHLV